MKKDGGAVIAALGAQNIPYKVEQGGATIMVPGDKANELRLQLASQGLPKGGIVGFELMDVQKLGMSQFNEQITYQRGLEGELAHTIQSISSVSSARVHLAIPKQTAFLRDEEKPTASVVLTLYSGRTLEPSQVAGIVNLVASSVPKLSPDQVSIIDQQGNLLARKRDARMGGLDATQLEYVRHVEKSYMDRIQNILLPLLGEGNFRAQVAADVDFDSTEQTSEVYKPNPTPTTAPTIPAPTAPMCASNAPTCPKPMNRPCTSG